MPWLIDRTVRDAQAFEDFLLELATRLDDPDLERSDTVRETLAEVMYGMSYEALHRQSPMAAFALDPRNITFEAEYYRIADQEKFARVKPLLWLWKSLDLIPLGQSVHSGLRLRRMLAERVFKRAGKNLKIFQNVEVSFGYNIEVGDNVVIHRNVLIDDIGGVEIHDGASLSDYVNVYSHTHDLLDSPDVTLKRTIIGRGVRVAYHATVLAGTVLSDDSMLGALALATRDLEPHAVGLGIPAKARVWKDRTNDPRYRELEVDARTRPPVEPVRANPDYQDQQAKEPKREPV